jgi:hypothetical protein
MTGTSAPPAAGDAGVCRLIAIRQPRVDPGHQFQRFDVRLSSRQPCENRNASVHQAARLPTARSARRRSSAKSKLVGVDRGPHAIG